MDDREFKYGGRMYDIVAVRVSADSITYWCYPDDAETRIDRQLSDWINHAAGQTPPGRGQLEYLGDFFKSLYHPPAPSRAPAADVQLLSRALPEFMLTRFVSREQAPPVPPPRAPIA